MPVEGGSDAVDGVDDHGDVMRADATRKVDRVTLKKMAAARRLAQAG